MSYRLRFSGRRRIAPARQPILGCTFARLPGWRRTGIAAYAASCWHEYLPMAGPILQLGSAIVAAGAAYVLIVVVFSAQVSRPADLKGSSDRENDAIICSVGLPDGWRKSLLLLRGGVPGARWSQREQLHLTLRFIGEVDGRDAAAIEDALAADFMCRRFTLELKGVGEFGGKILARFGPECAMTGPCSTSSARSRARCSVSAFRRRAKIRAARHSGD